MFITVCNVVTFAISWFVYSNVQTSDRRVPTGKLAAHSHSWEEDAQWTKQIENSYTDFLPLFSLCRKDNIHEKLEVDPSTRTVADFANIVPRQRAKEGPLDTCRLAPTATSNSSFSEAFVDDPDVPLLI